MIIQGAKRKYKVLFDDEQCTLIELNTPKEGKNKGVEMEGKKRYWPYLHQLVDQLFQMELSDSDAETLKDAQKCINATRRLVKTSGLSREH